MKKRKINKKYITGSKQSFEGNKQSSKQGFEGNKQSSKQSFEGHNKKDNFICGNFISGLSYVKKSWVFIVFAIILMSLAFIVGYFGIIGIISHSIGKTIDSYVLKSVQELIMETAGMGPAELTGFITINNIKTAFFGMLSGLFFAVSSVAVVIFNGYVLGFVAQRAVVSTINTEGIFVLWRLFPHGIFEIPAILISIGLGIKLGLYPFFIREKGKGFLSLLISLAIFIFLSMIISTIVVLLIQPNILTAADNPASKEAYNIILKNPVFSIIFLILIALAYILSIIIGLKVLSNNDKGIVKEILADSFRAFVFVVIPLLIVAGVIEGILIALLG